MTERQGAFPPPLGPHHSNIQSPDHIYQTRVYPYSQFPPNQIPDVHNEASFRNVVPVPFTNYPFMSLPQMHHHPMNSKQPQSAFYPVLQHQPSGAGGVSVDPRTGRTFNPELGSSNSTFQQAQQQYFTHDPRFFQQQLNSAAGQTQSSNSGGGNNGSGQSNAPGNNELQLPDIARMQEMRNRSYNTAMQNTLPGHRKKSHHNSSRHKRRRVSREQDNEDQKTELIQNEENNENSNENSEPKDNVRTSTSNYNSKSDSNGNSNNNRDVAHQRTSPGPIASALPVNMGYMYPGLPYYPGYYGYGPPNPTPLKNGEAMPTYNMQYMPSQMGEVCPTYFPFDPKMQQDVSSSSGNVDSNQDQAAAFLQKKEQIMRNQKREAKERTNEHYALKKQQKMIQRHNKSQGGTVEERSEKKSPSNRAVRRRRSKNKKPGTSNFRGVSWHKRDKSYVARVWIDGKSEHLGVYREELSAALAVDEKMLSLPGTKKRDLNFSTHLQRDIVKSVLKNYKRHEEVKNSKRKRGDISDDSIMQVGVSKDRNGFPNNVEHVLSNILLKNIRGSSSSSDPSSSSNSNSTVSSDNDKSNANSRSTSNQSGNDEPEGPHENKATTSASNTNSNTGNNSNSTSSTQAFNSNSNTSKSSNSKNGSSGSGSDQYNKMSTNSSENADTDNNNRTGNERRIHERQQLDNWNGLLQAAASHYLPMKDQARPGIAGPGSKSMSTENSMSGYTGDADADPMETHESELSMTTDKSKKTSGNDSKDSIETEESGAVAAAEC